MGDCAKIRVGVVGYGSLGKYMVERILNSDVMELVFVWNRTYQSMADGIPESLILGDLKKFSERKADLIVEVAHPSISAEYGAQFLLHADYLVGSPTAFADAETEFRLRHGAKQHQLFLPAGALWGGSDIQKMSDAGTLKGLKITMSKHPSAFRLLGDLKVKNEGIVDKAVTLYNGPVRELCTLAPNNVNTMAVAAIAAGKLGFDGVEGCLVSDPNLKDWHIVEVEARGPSVDLDTSHVEKSKEKTCFTVHTIRKNPAARGAVTGSATYVSFYSSLLVAVSKNKIGTGIHLC